MTPIEKANELLDKFWLMDKVQPMLTKEQAKQCALVAVDEILNSFYNIFDDFVVESSKVGGYRNMKKYWQEVKQEIEKL